MTTYVLIHGASHGPWCWNLLTAELGRRGHQVVVPELPCEDESAGLPAYADAVVGAVGGRADLIVVAHSLGALAAPRVCDRLAVDLLVLVAGMVPAPGQTGEELFDEVHADQQARGAGVPDDRGPGSDPLIADFYADVPPDLAAEAVRRLRGQAATPMREPWPPAAWPDLPNQIPALPRRPRPARPLAPPGRPRTPRRHPRRDRRQPLSLPQPSEGARRALGGLPVRAVSREVPTLRPGRPPRRHDAVAVPSSWGGVGWGDGDVVLGEEGVRADDFGAEMGDLVGLDPGAGSRRPPRGAPRSTMFLVSRAI
jgi:Alpha/beta hydrolase family